MVHKLLHALKESPHVVHFLKREFDNLDTDLKNSTNDSDATGFFFPKELVDRTIECLRAKEVREKQDNVLEKVMLSVEEVISRHIGSLTDRLNCHDRTEKNT